MPNLQQARGRSFADRSSLYTDFFTGMIFVLGSPECQTPLDDTDHKGAYEGQKARRTRSSSDERSDFGYDAEQVQNRNLARLGFRARTGDAFPRQPRSRFGTGTEQRWVRSLRAPWPSPGCDPGETVSPRGLYWPARAPFLLDWRISPVEAEGVRRWHSGTGSWIPNASVTAAVAQSLRLEAGGRRWSAGVRSTSKDGDFGV